MVSLPTDIAERAGIRRAFQDGQSGWLGMAFAASCAYDVAQGFAAGHVSQITSWLVLGLVLLFLASLGCALLGTLFPVDARGSKAAASDLWRRNGLMLTSLCTMATSGVLLWLNHA
jgi:hypothetical protein